MRQMTIGTTITTLLLALAVPALSDDLAAIKKALDAKYAVTTTTADKTDIVTAGSVLVLKKSNLLTLVVTKPLFFANSYKNGKIGQAKMIALANTGGKMEGGRTFVAGEKLWLTGIEIKDKEVSFELFSDAINDARYRGKLNFPLEKDGSSTVESVAAAVAQVFDVQQENGGGQQQQTQQQPPQQQQQPQRQAVVEAPPPPIAPPPPPPEDPKEIKLGQTTAQVIANFGQPTSILKPTAAKQIYVYKDMKVVFVGGKVSDVQ